MSRFTPSIRNATLFAKCKLGASGALILVACAVSGAVPPSETQDEAAKAITFRENLPVGGSIEVKSTVNLTGKMTPSNPREKAATTAITASGAARYRERILEKDDDNSITLTARRYLVATLDKKTGETSQRIILRPNVERVVLRRVEDQSTVFSPEGPLTAPELDMVQADAFTASLFGLLPNDPVKRGDRWQASAEAAEELTGVGPIQSGALACTLAEIKSSGDQAIARVNVAGSIAGPSEQGPCRLKVEGHYLFDIDQEMIVYVLLTGQSEILDGNGQTVGQLDGRYEIERRPTIDDPRLTDSALEGVDRKPSAETTALLFESNDLAVQFHYPRNWELKSAVKNIVQLHEPTGGALRITIDPTPAPSAEKLRSDLIAWVGTQKGEVKAASNVEPMKLPDPLQAQQFTVEAKLKDKPTQWTYLAVRDKNRAATVAANLTDERADALRKDVSFLAGSLRFMPKAAR